MFRVCLIGKGGRVAAVRRFWANTDEGAEAMARDMMRDAPAMIGFELWDGSRKVAEVAAEMVRFRGTSFDKNAKGYSFARAALIDPAFKAQLAEVHGRPAGAPARPIHRASCWHRARRYSGISNARLTWCSADGRENDLSSMRRRSTRAALVRAGCERVWRVFRGAEPIPIQTGPMINSTAD